MSENNHLVQDGTEEEVSIRNVSETALVMAYFRAQETRRHNALFRDPYAELLAGERGKVIASSSLYDKNSALSVTVRTYLIDEMIMRLIRGNAIDTILNLGAGLDTRPYRLPIPASIRWIEVDLPDILTYKSEKLAGVQPVCELQSVRMDLSNAKDAKTLFANIGTENGKVLVLSEGLLAWLSNEDAKTLAESLHVQANFNWWLMDLITAALSRMLAQSRSSKAMNAGNARMQFAPEEGAAFFASFGWEVAELRSMGEEAHRLHRETSMARIWRLLMPLVPHEKRKMYTQFDSHIVLLQHV